MFWYATWQSVCTTRSNVMIGLENGVERKEINLFHVMVVKDGSCM